MMTYFKLVVIDIDLAARMCAIRFLLHVLGEGSCGTDLVRGTVTLTLFLPYSLSSESPFR
jgi:hypothetical protein